MTIIQSTLDFDQTLPASIDQAQTAVQILDEWAFGDTAVTDEGIARLLAATMHDGPGSVLEQFAATGELDAEKALAELNEVKVPLEREAWIDALGHYIVNVGGRS